MTDDEINGIIAWVIERGLVGASEIELLHEFCERSVAAGLALSSAMAVIDTLHPIWEGRAFLWSSDGTEGEPAVEYGSSSVGENAERWERSAFYHKLNRTAPHRLWLMTTGGDEVRRRIGKGDPTDFYLLDGLKSEGHTDYVALVHRFASDGVIGEMDCVYSHWTTRKADGFSEEDCAALRRLVPALALASKSASLARIAGTLVEVYLAGVKAFMICSSGLGVPAFSKYKASHALAVGASGANRPGIVIPAAARTAVSVITTNS